MNSRRTTLPIPPDRVERMRTELSPRYGFETWEDRESGHPRILVVRVPGDEPDLVNDLEAAVEYVSPGDLQGVRTLLLIGNQRTLTVSGQPFKDLMSARVQADRRMCAAVRPQLRQPTLYRAPEDPHKLLRLMVPIPRRQVKDLDDVDLDRLAKALEEHLDDPEWTAVRCVYLVAAEDDVRIDADLFFQDLTQRVHDMAAAAEAQAQAQREREAERTAPTRPEATPVPPPVLEEDDDPIVADPAAQPLPPVQAMQSPVAAPPIPGPAPAPSAAPPSAYRSPGPATPAHIPAHAAPASMAHWARDPRIGDAEKRELLAELERRYGRRVAVAPVRRMALGATWEAEAQSDVHARRPEVQPRLGVHGRSDAQSARPGAHATPDAQAQPNVQSRPDAPGGRPDLREVHAATDRLPAVRPEPIEIGDAPGTIEMVQDAPATQDGASPSAMPSANPSASPLEPLPTAQPGASAAPSIEGLEREAQPSEPSHGASQAQVSVQATRQETHAAQLQEHLRARGFEVLADPRVPGHRLDLAAERASGYPQRIIACLPERLTLDVADAILLSSRALDVDLALVVCSEADAEARKRLIATKAKWIAPLDIPNLLV